MGGHKGVPKKTSYRRAGLRGGGGSIRNAQMSYFKFGFFWNNDLSLLHIL
jgi:hypothetical protein